VTAADIAGLAAATFVGALVQAATGFGFAILAAPAFLAIIATSAAVPLLVLLHIVQSVMVGPSAWAATDSRLTGLLALGAVIGCPLGVLLFLRIDLASLKLLVGVLIVLFTLLLIARERGLLQWLAQPGSGGAGRGVAAPIATGIASGVMTALMVMPGPPVMLYLMGQVLPKALNRAVSLSFFGICYVLVAIMSAATGGIGTGLIMEALMLAPFVVAGTLAGERLSTRLGEGAFRGIILGLLLVSGLAAIWSALR
jgi:uncharacterized membrane protein YfcA